MLIKFLYCVPVKIKNSSISWGLIFADEAFLNISRGLIFADEVTMTIFEKQQNNKFSVVLVVNGQIFVKKSVF